jgi:hypothetical protein
MVAIFAAGEDGRGCRRFQSASLQASEQYLLEVPASR